MLQEIIKEVAERGKSRSEHSTANPKSGSLSTQEFPGRVLGVSEDEEKESVLEKEADNPVEIKLEEEMGAAEDHVPASLRYLRLDENRMRQFTGDESETKDWYSRMTFMPEEEDYQPPKPISNDDDNAAYISLTEEAREEIKDLKYEFLNPQEIDTSKIKLLSLYQALNPAEFAFYEYILNLNRDSVYQ
ncbi:MAG: hypothetical protein AABY40_03815 [Nanoarchaeota archaeon]